MSKKTTIMEMNIEKIKQSLISGNVTICVIGIGRIGLPTALSFAKSGLPTIGLDINKNLISMINAKEFPLKDEPGYLEIFNEVIHNKKFNATNNVEETISKADVVLLSLPTPMDKNNIPDYSALKVVGNQLHENLKEGSIVIVESTVEPGFVENELIKIIEGDDLSLKAGINFGIGVCPETANPGEILRDFEKLPRLVGAIDEKTTNIILEIYRHVFTVDIIKMSNCKTANAVKLTTNVFRDLNIAFVNELSLLFEKLGINTLDVLEAAKRKYNFQVHYPGAGVGGPCLPVNSYQLLNTAKKTNFNTLRLVKTGREINEYMPLHIVQLIQDAFSEAKEEIDKNIILIMGISYKPDVKDIQLTPAEPIIKKLKDLGATVKIYDPYFKDQEVFGIKTEKNLIDALSASSAAVIVTAHKEFHDIDPSFLLAKMKKPIVIDTRGVIDYHSAKKLGLVFKSLGIGQ